MDISKIKTEPPDFDFGQRYTAETKCGIIFRRGEHAYDLICEFCAESFNDMVQFTFHLESKHFRNDLRMHENQNIDAERNINAETSGQTKEEKDGIYAMAEVPSKGIAQTFETQQHEQTHRMNDPIEHNDNDSQNEDITPSKEEGFYEDIKQELLDDSWLELSMNEDESMQANDMDATSVYQAPNSNDQRFDEKKLQCKICERNYESLKAFRHHVYLHKRMDKPDQAVQFKVFCEFCGIGFKYMHWLRTHLVLEHKNRIPRIFRDDPTYLACERCNQSYETPIERYEHEQTHKSGEPYYCRLCSRPFSKLTYRDIHLRTHQPDIRPFPCDICGKGFKTQTDTRQHMLIHGEKSHKCEQCEMMFRTKNSLRQHMHFHSDKRYNCEHCPKVFVSFRKLKNHLVVHNDERPFECSECKATFKHTASLKKHLRMHEREKQEGSVSSRKTYKCEHCEMVFTLHQKYKRHVVSHTKERKSKLT